MTDTAKHKRYSKDEILAKLRLQETSSSTVTEFCKAHHIHKATFYNWGNRFSLELESSANLYRSIFQSKLLLKNYLRKFSFRQRFGLSCFSRWRLLISKH